MMRRFIAILILSLAPGWAFCAESRVDSFDMLLDEAELRFQPPGGFVDLTPATNEVIDYERALRSEDGALEMRIAVRPLKRLRIDYDDPHGAIPDPNHIFPLVFESLASQLAGGLHAPSNTYSPADAKERFNADWAAAAVFDISDRFSTRYQQGLLLALHRNKVADAYVIYLFDDYEKVRDSIKAAMDTLVYR